MSKLKPTKAQRIAELQRKLVETEAQLTFKLGVADVALEEARTEHLKGSGVVLSLAVLGGRELIRPTLIRNGLSDDTVAALRRDLLRSYEIATSHKPKDRS